MRGFHRQFVSPVSESVMLGCYSCKRARTEFGPLFSRKVNGVRGRPTSTGVVELPLFPDILLLDRDNVMKIYYNGIVMQHVFQEFVAMRSKLSNTLAKTSPTTGLLSSMKSRSGYRSQRTCLVLL